MIEPGTLVIRTFLDRADGLGHFFQRAGEAPRLLAYDDVAGCPVETALGALEWTGAVGILPDDDQVHAARLTADTAAAVVERRTGDSRMFLYLGPRLDPVNMDTSEGTVLFADPVGVKAVEFQQRAHALAFFFRATGGVGCMLSLMGRRAPEIRHLRRWFGAILRELQTPRQLVAGWFAATAAGALFAGTEDDPASKYIEVGMES
ncbi:MAG: hypothetical protein M3N43_15125 [Actinomycetota bacterium]|nr:hypothetical protein [Actinomycetota bacterium]